MRDRYVTRAWGQSRLALGSVVSDRSSTIIRFRLIVTRLPPPRILICVRLSVVGEVRESLFEASNFMQHSNHFLLLIQHLRVAHPAARCTVRRSMGNRSRIVFGALRLRGTLQSNLPHLRVKMTCVVLIVEARQPRSTNYRWLDERYKLCRVKLVAGWFSPLKKSLRQERKAPFSHLLSKLPYAGIFLLDDLLICLAILLRCGDRLIFIVTADLFRTYVSGNSRRLNDGYQLIYVRKGSILQRTWSDRC